MSEAASRYTLLDSLGNGGMGGVFLADDTQLGRKVAIKFLTAALEDDANTRERLHREARSAAALDHPYICNIYEIAEIDGRTGFCPSSSFLGLAQKIANGFSGEPVPPGFGIGAATSRNSHRLSRAAVSASASRAMLSKMFAPSATSTSLWNERTVPGIWPTFSLTRARGPEGRENPEC